MQIGILAPLHHVNITNIWIVIGYVRKLVGITFYDNGSKYVSRATNKFIFVDNSFITLCCQVSKIYYLKG